MGLYFGAEDDDLRRVYVLSCFNYLLMKWVLTIHVNRRYCTFTWWYASNLMICCVNILGNLWFCLTAKPPFHSFLIVFCFCFVLFCFVFLE